MGVCRESVEQWERGKQPSDRLWPRVVAFMGYDPTPAPETAGARLRLQRRSLGLSMRALAGRVGCDERTVTAWEQDRATPSQGQWGRLRTALGSPSHSSRASCPQASAFAKGEDELD